MLEDGVKVLFAEDNLSCLFSGVKENDADASESVLQWLLTLRRHRIAVEFVHHSGRNKETMRGTSRREHHFENSLVKSLAPAAVESR